VTVYLLPLILIGGLATAGVYLLTERNLTRLLLGLLLVGNAVNLLILTVGGPAGNPPIDGRTSAGQTGTADPLAQAMILTAIVITMGVAAFVLALAYRSYRLTTDDDVADDDEDTRVLQTAEQVSGPADLPVDDTPTPGAEEPRPAALDDAPDELDAVPEGS